MAFVTNIRYDLCLGVEDFENKLELGNKENEPSQECHHDGHVDKKGRICHDPDPS